MDKIILGILMLKRLTIYEMRNIIKLNFQSMCSDSMGSIQAAIKKLLANEMVTYNEFVEKGVNKKVYSITDSGRIFFLDWLKKPMDMAKSKNMELGKLLFMGLIPMQERATLISEIILKLKNELTYLEEIQKNSSNHNQDIQQFLNYLEQDPEYLLGLQNATKNSSNEENVRGISIFEALTLQLGIDNTKFYINWFESLRDKLEKERLD